MHRAKFSKPGNTHAAVLFILTHSKITSAPARRHTGAVSADVQTVVTCGRRGAVTETGPREGHRLGGRTPGPDSGGGGKEVPGRIIH